MNRGDVYDIAFPRGRRPGVIVTREAAIEVLANVTVVEVTSTVRGVPTEVALGPREGLKRDCVALCDNIHTVPKAALGAYRGSLGPEPIRALDTALKIALALD